MLFMSDLSFAQNYHYKDTCFFSDILGEYKFIRAYLPPGYEFSTEKYPVVYYLHPAGGIYEDVIEWMELTDSLISEELIHPMLLIGLDGQCPPYCGSFFTNSVLYGNYEDYIIQEAIPFAESVFRTMDTSQFRCILGETMGGYGAMKLGLKYPDMFAGMASYAGFLQLDTLLSLWQIRLMLENTGPPYHFMYNGAGMFTNLTFGGSGAFSPNLNILPYMVEFPYDTNCAIVDTVKQKWKEHDCARLVKSLNTINCQNPGIFFCCSTNDWADFYPGNECFEDTLIELGLPYTFLTTQDFSHGATDSSFTIGMQFFDSIMFSLMPRIAIPAEEDCIPLEVYPNPFRDLIHINTQEDAMLSVYSMSGELLYQSKRFQTSESLNLSFLPSGVYVLVVKSGRRTASRKIVKH